MKSGNSSGGDLEEIRVESLESGMSSSLDLSKEPVQPPKWYRHITGAPAAGWHDVRKFIKARKGQGRILMVLAILQYGILLLLAYLINISLFYKASGDHCAGGGDFSLFNNGYDWWTGADFFQITLSTGNFSFTLAKIVDSLWDVSIGRGGQAVFVWISWHVFRDYVAISMIKKPVTFSTFFNMFLQKDPGPLATCSVLKDFTNLRGLCSNFAMAYIIGSMLFCLGYPTLAGSMTGYTTSFEPYLGTDSGLLIPLDQARRIAYTIHDGHRINLTDNYEVYFYKDANCEAQTITWGLSEYAGNSIYSDCVGKYANDTVNYLRKYGFESAAKGSTKWKGIEIPAPGLNITAFFIPPAYGNPTQPWYTPTDEPSDDNEFLNFYGVIKYSDPDAAVFSFGNEMHDVKYMQHNGFCQPQNTYEWGFSFIQLFIMVICIEIWLICTFLMCLNTCLATDALELDTAVPRGWGAVLMLAQAIKRQFEGTGIEPQSLKGDSLNKQVQSSFHGGSVISIVRVSIQDYSFPKAISSWIKREKWWLVGLCTSCIAFMGCAYGPLVHGANNELGAEMMPWPLFSPLTITALCLFSMAAVVGSIVIGKDAKSRIFLFLCMDWVGATVCGMIFYVVIAQTPYDYYYTQYE